MIIKLMGCGRQALSGTGSAIAWRRAHQASGARVRQSGIGGHLNQMEFGSPILYMLGILMSSSLFDGFQDSRSLSPVPVPVMLRPKRYWVPRLAEGTPASPEFRCQHQSHSYHQPPCRERHPAVARRTGAVLRLAHPLRGCLSCLESWRAL